MSTACFARAPQRYISRLSKHFLLTFQEVTPFSNTRNQLAMSLGDASEMKSTALKHLPQNNRPFFESAPFFSHNTTRLDCIAGAWVIDCRSRQGYNGCIILALCEHAEAAQNTAGCAWRRGGRPLLATCVTLPGEDVHITIPGESCQAMPGATVSLCRLALAPPCVRTQAPRLLAYEGASSWQLY